MNLSSNLQFLYGMKYRGFSPMCQPMDGLYEARGETSKYHNVLVYNRRLTDKEVRDYELEFVGFE